MSYHSKIPLMNISRQYLEHKKHINNRIQKVLNSGNFIMSDEVKNFENNLCKYHDVKHAITVGNGTDALILSLKSLGIGWGDEVIVPSMSFFATSEAVVQVGAKPVFIDINEIDFTLDYSMIEEKITSKTKALIPVHLYGKLSNMKKIMNIAKKYNLFVIEDNCQAIGAKYQGKVSGTFGDLSCISFFPTKNLGAYGDGGVILTNNDSLAIRLRALRVHGSGINGVESSNFFNKKNNDNNSNNLNKIYSEFINTKYNNSIIGYNSRLDELQAAILDYKLNYIDEWNEKRIFIATRYYNEIKNTSINHIKHCGDGSHVYYVYIIFVSDRKKFIEYMEKNNISTGIYFPIPLHLQPAHINLQYNFGDFPTSEYLSLNSVAIPIFPELKNEEVDYIIDCINKF